MKAVVVYESLFGSTAAVARAIAGGIGADARVLTTAEASSEEIAGADLLVAGAPVHTLSLPSAETRKQAMGKGPGGRDPDLSHPPMRQWLARLTRGEGLSAAFETRVNAWYGRGAASRIARRLKRAGYRPAVKPAHFLVGGPRWIPDSDHRLLEGETERARRWGEELRRAAGEETRT